MSKSIWIVVIALLVIVVGYMFFAQAPETSAPAPTTVPTNIIEAQPTPTTPQETIPTVSSGQEVAPALVKELTIEASEFAYNVKTINVAPGQKVKITLVNKGKMIHDVDIDGVVDSPIIAAGEQESIEFSAPVKAGSYEYYCSVGSHRQQGMKGQLVVE